MPLLYKFFFELLNRQLEFGSRDAEGIVVKHLWSFIEIIEPFTKADGLMTLWGIMTNEEDKITPRIRFLAVALSLFLRNQITPENKLFKKKEFNDG